MSRGHLWLHHGWVFLSNFLLLRLYQFGSRAAVVDGGRAGRGFLRFGGCSSFELFSISFLRKGYATLEAGLTLLNERLSLFFSQLQFFEQNVLVTLLLLELPPSFFGFSS